MSIESYLSAIGGEVTNQADQLEIARTMLLNKAAGGGGSPIAGEVIAKMGAGEFHLSDIGLLRESSTSNYVFKLTSGGTVLWEATHYEKNIDSVNGWIPRWKFEVTAGDVVDIEAVLTAAQGYLWDGRGCGLSYKLNNNTIGYNHSSFTVPRDGTFTVSAYYGATFANGAIDNPGNDNLKGEYLKVSIYPNSNAI